VRFGGAFGHVSSSSRHRRRLIGTGGPALADLENTSWPNYEESDFTITDYKFASAPLASAPPQRTA
jgi:hypothetical protein